MEEQEQDRQKNHDRFTDFMYGPKKSHHRKDYPPQESSTSSSSIDYEELLNTIDTLMDSVKSLKPVVHSVVTQFLKKK